MKSFKVEVEVEWVENNGMYTVWAWDEEQIKHIASMCVFKSDDEQELKRKCCEFMGAITERAPF